MVTLKDLLRALPEFMFLSGDKEYHGGAAGRRYFAVEEVPPPTVRASALDRLADLRGHDNIQARGLDRQTPECFCPTCERDRLLPAVRRICGMPEMEA